MNEFVWLMLVCVSVGWVVFTVGIVFIGFILAPSMKEAFLGGYEFAGGWKGLLLIGFGCFLSWGFA